VEAIDQGGWLCDAEHNASRMVIPVGVLFCFGQDLETTWRGEVVEHDVVDAEGGMARASRESFLRDCSEQSPSTDRLEDGSKSSR